MRQFSGDRSPTIAKGCGTTSEGSRAAPAPLYRKLKPGPGHSREEVLANQRARLHGAMIELVADRGYQAVTVRDLARAAALSRTSFYAQFRDKEECFLATYEIVARQAARRVLETEREGGEGRDQLRAGFAAFADQLAEKPKAARLALVESLAAGPVVLKRVRQRMGLFEALVKSRFAAIPGGVELPGLLVKGIVGGAASMARGRLLAGRHTELGQLAGPLLDWSLSFNDEAALELGPRQRVAERQVICSHRIARADLEQSFYDERGLILVAAARLAANEGYEMLTPPRIRAAAGVSRRSFDANFDDVADCFLASIGQRAETVLEEAALAYDAGANWAQGVYLVLVAISGALARDPTLARLAFVEVFASGSAALAWRQELIAAVAERLRLSAPPGQRPSELAAEASVAAIWTVVHDHVAAGRIRSLPTNSDVLAFLALAPAIGAKAALAATRLEVSRAASHRAGWSGSTTVGSPPESDSRPDSDPISPTQGSLSI